MQFKIQKNTCFQNIATTDNPYEKEESKDTFIDCTART